MKMQVVEWRGNYYVFGYENETGSESAPDEREVMVCQMADKLEELKDLISDSAPLCWANSGDTEAAYEWEKRAQKLLA